jgi:cytochrome c-type biogenesis protein CcsB
MTEQVGIVLFKISFWFYLAASICYVANLVNSRSMAGKLATGILLGGVVVHTASIAIITAVIGRLPFLNLYEYLLMFTWGAALVYAVLEFATKNRSLGSFIVPLVMVFTFLTCRLPSDINHSVMPVLRSAWRVPHIASAILAYSAFLVACILAIIYLVRERSGEDKQSFWGTRLPALKVIDQAVYRTIAFGFLMQTVLLIAGAIWAQYAWGRYWGWDPKETWALITWLIYAAYLHTRVTLGWRGRKSAVLAIVGFVAVGFTLFGVSFLLKGLHSYATM